jgi:hypothetical protein
MMYHMKKNEENQITQGRKTIAGLAPKKMPPAAEYPEFLARLRAIYGDQFLKVSGAELIAKDRGEF